MLWSVSNTVHLYNPLGIYLTFMQTKEKMSCCLQNYLVYLHSLRRDTACHASCGYLKYFKCYVKKYKSYGSATKLAKCTTVASAPFGLKVFLVQLKPYMSQI